MKQAVVILIPHDTWPNTFLGVSRKNNSLDFGFPGGKVENESLLEAGLRECKEETGLDAFDLVPFFQGKVGEFLVTCFLGKVRGKIFSRETGQVAWVSRECLLSGTFKEYNTNVFKLFDGKV